MSGWFKDKAKIASSGFADHGELEKAVVRAK
jgi:hypothetical protein